MKLRRCCECGRCDVPVAPGFVNTLVPHILPREGQHPRICATGRTQTGNGRRVDHPAHSIARQHEIMWNATWWEL